MTARTHHRSTAAVSACFALACLLAAALPPPAGAADETGTPRRPLRSACEIDYPPFSLVDAQGEANGFSVELLRAALAAMGREVTFRTGPWNEVRSWLETGEVEALPLVGRTPERDPLFDFTFPYMSLHGAIVVRKGTEHIRDLRDLKGRRVAVMRGDNAEEFLRREGRGIEILPTPTFLDALRDLSEGRCDAVVIQRLVGLRLLQEHPFPDLRVLDKPIEGFRQDFCFAVREGDRATLALLNEGLALVMADGTYRHLHARWFAALQLPARRRIVVGGDHNFPPYEYLDEDGRPAGFNVDLTRAVARQMELDAEIRLGPWARVRRELAGGEIDVLQGMFYSTERDLAFDFSPSYLVNPYVAVVRRGGRPPPSSLEQLRGLDLVVQDGDIMHDFALQNGLQDGLTAVDSQEDALRQLAEGKHDCALVSRLTALFWIEERGWDNLVLGYRALLSPEYCFAVPQNQQALLAQITEGLKVLDETGELRRIREKWLGVYKGRGLSLLDALRVSAMVLVPLILVLLGVFLWSWSLRRQVARKTREVTESTEKFRYFFDSANVGKSVTLPTGEVDVNPAFAELLGYTREELSGKNWREVTPGDEIERTQRELDPLLRGEKETTRFRKAYLHRDGSRVWADVSVRIRRGADGAPLYFVATVVDITEQKHAEDALRERTEVLDAILENIPVMIATLDPRGAHRYVNRCWERTLGWSREEARAPEIFEQLYPDAEYRLEVEAWIALANGQWRDFRTRTRRGTVLDTRWASIRLADGSSIGIGFDITERLRAELALRESERHFRNLADSGTALIWTCGAEGHFDYFNRTWLAFRGRSAGEESGTGWTAGVHPEDLARFMKTYHAAFSRRQAFRSVLRLLRHDGDYRWIQMDGSPRTDSDKRFIGFIGHGLDVTDLKLAREQIEHLNKVLRAIRDVNQLIVHEHDPDRLIREACRLMVDNRGYAGALIVRTDAEERPLGWAEAGTAGRSSSMRALFEGGGLPPCCRRARAHQGFCVIRGRDGICRDCPAASSQCDDADAMCIRLASGGNTFGYLAVTMDPGLGVDPQEESLFREMAGDIAYALRGLQIDRARQESERKRLALEGQLLQAQKMESVGRLAGGVAHDYNNMLGIILGYAELGQQKTSASDPLHAILEEILKAGTRSMEITRQLLAFARKQTVTPRVLLLNDTLENMLNMLRNLIGEHIELAWLPGTDLWPVWMDPTQVDQVLVNLCVNARDAIEGSGKITIESGNAEFDSAFCRENPGFLTGQFVFLAVADTGKGMDAETLENIFEPFFTTKKPGSGTGLGLATVYGIVQQNEGFIQVESAPAEGTTFRVYLPRHTVRVETPIPERPVSELLRGSETILLVEDEEALLAMTETMLRNLGYQVLRASSPGEAIRLAGTYGGKIDLLLTDVVMPEMNGRELAETIQSIHPGIRHLFVSGYSTDVVARSGVLDEGVHFIGKPFSLRDLGEKIREALGS